MPAFKVMRQTSFVNKMVTLGWTEDDRFEDNKDTLARCINRYHAFLDLMISTPGKFVVPTLVCLLVNEQITFRYNFKEYLTWPLHPTGYRPCLAHSSAAV